MNTYYFGDKEYQAESEDQALDMHLKAMKELHLRAGRVFLRIAAIPLLIALVVSLYKIAQNFNLIP